MRHELTTRLVVVLAVTLLGVAVLFAIAANVEPTEPVDPERALAAVLHPSVSAAVWGPA